MILIQKFFQPLQKTGKLEKDTPAEMVSFAPVHGRPAFSDYMIINSCENQAASFRRDNYGSYLIQLLCQAIKDNPREELLDLMTKINQAQTCEGGTNVFIKNGRFYGTLQFPYLCNFSYHFRLQN